MSLAFNTDNQLLFPPIEHSRTSAPLRVGLSQWLNAQNSWIGKAAPLNRRHRFRHTIAKEQYNKWHVLNPAIDIVTSESQRLAYGPSDKITNLRDEIGNTKPKGVQTIQRRSESEPRRLSFDRPWRDRGKISSVKEADTLFMSAWLWCGVTLTPTRPVLKVGNGSQPQRSNSCYGIATILRYHWLTSPLHFWIWQQCCIHLSWPSSWYLSTFASRLVLRPEHPPPLRAQAPACCVHTIWSQLGRLCLQCPSLGSLVHAPVRYPLWFSCDRMHKFLAATSSESTTGCVALLNLQLQYLRIQESGRQSIHLSHSSVLFVHRLVYSNPSKDFVVENVCLQDQRDSNLLPESLRPW